MPIHTWILTMISYIYRVTQKKASHSVLWLKSVVEVWFYFFTGVSEQGFRARYTWAPYRYPFRIRKASKTQNNDLFTSSYQEVCSFATGPGPQYCQCQWGLPRGLDWFNINWKCKTVNRAINRINTLSALTWIWQTFAWKVKLDHQNMF